MTVLLAMSQCLFADSDTPSLEELSYSITGSMATVWGLDDTEGNDDGAIDLLPTGSGISSGKTQNYANYHKILFNNLSPLRHDDFAFLRIRSYFSLYQECLLSVHSRNGRYIAILTMPSETLTGFWGDSTGTGAIRINESDNATGEDAMPSKNLKPISGDLPNIKIRRIGKIIPFAIAQRISIVMEKMLTQVKYAEQKTFVLAEGETSCYVFKGMELEGYASSERNIKRSALLVSMLDDIVSYVEADSRKRYDDFDHENYYLNHMTEKLGMLEKHLHIIPPIPVSIIESSPQTPSKEVKRKDTVQHQTRSDHRYLPVVVDNQNRVWMNVTNVPVLEVVRRLNIELVKLAPRPYVIYLDEHCFPGGDYWVDPCYVNIPEDEYPLEDGVFERLSREKNVPLLTINADGMPMQDIIRGIIEQQPAHIRGKAGATLARLFPINTNISTRDDITETEQCYGMYSITLKRGDTMELVFSDMPTEKSEDVAQPLISPLSKLETRAFNSSINIDTNLYIWMNVANIPIPEIIMGLNNALDNLCKPRRLWDIRLLGANHWKNADGNKSTIPAVTIHAEGKPLKHIFDEILDQQSDAILGVYDEKHRKIVFIPKGIGVTRVTIHNTVPDDDVYINEMKPIVNY
jgi:hypothetical protein